MAVGSLVRTHGCEVTFGPVSAQAKTWARDSRSIRGMWYKSGEMVRRGALTMLVFVLVLQLAGLASASACIEPCPDDGAGTTCPPVCSLCTTCTHAQQAIVRLTTPTVFLATAPLVGSLEPAQEPSSIAFDVFHIPLLG